MNFKFDLNNLVYFLAFLPFVNFGLNIIPADTQPFYFLIALSIIFFYRYKLSNTMIYLLIISIIGTIISNVVGFDLKKNFNLLIIALSLIYFHKKTFSKELVRLVTGIYCIFFYLWFIDPVTAFKVQSILVRNINDANIGFRGFPVLSTEAGLYAGTAIIIIELYLLKLREWKYLDYFLIGSMFLSVILSFSGTSIVFLIIFSALRLKKIKYLFVSILLLIITLSIVLEYSNESRLTYFFNIIISGDLVLLLSDPSLMYRISSLLVSLEFFYNYPFGGILVDNLQEKIQLIYYNGYYKTGIGMDSNIRLVSGFGYSLITNGIITILFFFTIFKKYFSIKGLVYYIITLFFSYSMIYPLGLILLIECSKINYVRDTRVN